MLAWLHGGDDRLRARGRRGHRPRRQHPRPARACRGRRRDRAAQARTPGSAATASSPPRPRPRSPRRSSSAAAGCAASSRTCRTPRAPTTTRSSRSSPTCSRQRADAGLTPELRHLAATEAAIARPELRFDLVRTGHRRLRPPRRRRDRRRGARPAPGDDARRHRRGRAPGAGRRRASATGSRTARRSATTLALVPLGYADGVPRAASSRAEVLDRRRRATRWWAASRWTSSSSTSATTRSRSATRWCCGATPATGAPTRRGVGRLGRHHQLRDRDAGRAARAAGLRAVIELVVPDADAMEALGARLAPLLRAGDLVQLDGELGAGKTTLTRGLGAALGAREAITSPTFVLAREHPTASGTPLVHVDAYRLATAAELEDLDLDWEHAIVVVEWGAGKLDDAARPARDRDRAPAGRRPARRRLAAPRAHHRRRRPLGRARRRARPRLDPVLLAIDTSAGTSVAVVDAGCVLGSADEADTRGHAEADRQPDRRARSRRRVPRPPRSPASSPAWVPARSPGCGSASPPHAPSRPARGIPVHPVASHDAVAFGAHRADAGRHRRPPPRGGLDDLRRRDARRRPAPRAPRRPRNRRRGLRAATSGWMPTQISAASLGLRRRAASRRAAAPPGPTSPCICAPPT